MSREPTADRAALIAQLDMAGRGLSTAAVMFHTALAAVGGLSATEMKAMDFLERSGPMTAGALAEHSGLAPASITALVNRLQKKGFAKRIQNPDDGRSVLIELDRQRLAEGAHLFDDFVGALHALYAGYSDDELRVIVRFLVDATRVQREATNRLPPPA